MKSKVYKVWFGFDSEEVEATTQENAIVLAKARRIKAGLDARFQKIEEISSISESQEQVFLAE